MGRPSAIVIGAVLLALAAPARAQSGSFTIDFSWQGTAACDPKAPPFTLKGVPAGTTLLKFTMQDLDVPTFLHGGGSIAYHGQAQTDRGAFSYQGPCPPHGQHHYRWTAEAFDGSGK